MKKLYFLLLCTSTAFAQFTYEPFNFTGAANANGCSSNEQTLSVSLGSITDDLATAYINVPFSGNISSNNLMPNGTTYGQPTQIS